MHDNLPVEYTFQFSTTMTTLVKIKLEQKERRVEMPLFPDHCCQIPPGLLGQFSPKNSAAREKIRPQAGHPPNHMKKCRKKIVVKNFWANFCKLLLNLGRN
jgi:hypothetical protein